MKNVAVFVVLLALFGCTDPISSVNPMPPIAGVVEFTPPAIFAQYWAEVEACAGRRGSMQDVNWYIIPDAPYLEWEGKIYGGMWFTPQNAIVIPGKLVGYPDLIRHEILHAILRVPGHPQIFYDNPCGLWYRP